MRDRSGLSASGMGTTLGASAVTVARRPQAQPCPIRRGDAAGSPRACVSQPLGTPAVWNARAMSPSKEVPLEGGASTAIHRLDGVVLRPVSYTHLRAHETRHDLVCRLLLE